MKSTLIEIVLVCETAAFWAVALPAAMVVFPAAALWEKGAALRRRLPRSGQGANHSARRLPALGPIPTPNSWGCQ